LFQGPSLFQEVSDIELRAILIRYFKYLEGSRVVDPKTAADIVTYNFQGMVCRLSRNFINGYSASVPFVARAADYDGFRGHFDLLPAVIDDGIAQILQNGALAYLSVLQAHHTLIQCGFGETALLPRRVSHGPYDHI
jgi:hypothetical protein